MKAVAATTEELGFRGLDVLVNNAGAGQSHSRRTSYCSMIPAFFVEQLLNMA